MTTRITIQQLESYLWDAAVLLRGTIDAGDYKQFIMPLLFYKRLCDVFDEETQAALEESGGDTGYAAFPENHRFQIPPDAHWREIRKVSRDVGQALQVALRGIETANLDRLYGIFGDAQWTNKDRLSDATLRDLIEHFSFLELTVANLPEDELGNGYEYLIKKFADDSGHTAAEFYTNRTVVHLMTEMLQPQPGESIYDPTCGSGGMILCSVAYLRHHGQEWRNVKLFGQERNLMTSSIARMNCFLHGIEDFRIERGDTLAEPKFVEGDKLKQFDVVLANPPYSIKQWDRSMFSQDPWGRNFLGTPPQGRADYAFWQHILASMSPKTGRCAILFPHGVLFRQEEAEMRKKLIEMDLIECVLGLGPNLFYNSSMEACIVICRSKKEKTRKGKILFINGVNEVTRDRTQSYLTSEHIDKIAHAYHSYKDFPGFVKVASNKEFQKNNYSIKIDLYAPIFTNINNSNYSSDSTVTNICKTFEEWNKSRSDIYKALLFHFPDMNFLPRVTNSIHLITEDDILKNCNRSSLKRIRFGDVVNFVKDTVDPYSGDLDRYIAGEHMDSENVHLTRWGIVGEGYLGPAFKRRFRKGQILYGSRRTYLKKVAYADFDGITANTTFVLESRDSELFQPLLPWIMLSNKFTEHSIRESKGSTNPYINWPDIAKFEFGIPSIDLQKQIAEIIWIIEEIKINLISMKELVSSIIELKIDNFLYEKTWHEFEIRDLLVDGPKNGFSPPAGEESGGIPTLSISCVRDGEIIPEGNLKYAKVNPEEVRRFKLCRDDILVVRGNGNRSFCGRAGIVKDFPEGCFYPDLLIRLRFNLEKLIPEFAVLHWNEPKSHLRLLKKAKSTNGIFKINGQDIQSHQLFVPPIPDQMKFLESLKPYKNLIEILSHSIEKNIKFQSTIINFIFGELCA